MLFSIIIPVYNVSQYLNACLDSVLAQNFSDYEVVCVNDGSTDDSLSILQQYAKKTSRIRIISQDNRGLSAARNAGTKQSQGKYVLFLDSDDWLEPDTLKILSANLSNEDMLCFNGRRYFEDTGMYEVPDTLESKDGISGWDYYTKHSLESRKFAFECVVLRLYRREFLQNNGLEFTEGIFHEDDMFTPVVCYYARTVKIIPYCLYNYRIRINSITTTPGIKHKIDYLYIANTLSNFFITQTDIDKKIVYRSLTHHYQAVFQKSNPEDDKLLLPLVNWHLYKTVSRTKLRHRVLYASMRMSPKLFRWILKNI